MLLGSGEDETDTGGGLVECKTREEEDEKVPLLVR